MKEPDFHIKALSDRQTNGQLRKLEGDPIASFDFFSNDYLGFVHDAIIMPKDSPKTKLDGTAFWGATIVTYDRKNENFGKEFHKLIKKS